MPGADPAVFLTKAVDFDVAARADALLSCPRSVVCAGIGEVQCFVELAVRDLCVDEVLALWSLVVPLLLLRADRLPSQRHFVGLVGLTADFQGHRPGKFYDLNPDYRLLLFRDLRPHHPGRTQNGKKRNRTYRHLAETVHWISRKSSYQIVFKCLLFPICSSRVIRVRPSARAVAPMRRSAGSRG